MNSPSNHDASNCNCDMISDLEVHLPPSPPTLHLSRAIPKRRTDSGRSSLDVHSSDSSPKASRKRPFKDVGNATRLPIPSSFVDDVLFRLNNEDSDDDASVRVKSPRKKPMSKQSKEALRQQLQQCKSELQSSGIKETTDLKAIDRPNCIVEATASHEIVVTKPNVQPSPPLQRDAPKDTEACVSVDRDVSCTNHHSNNVESSGLAEFIRDSLQRSSPVAPLDEKKVQQNVRDADLNSNKHPGEAAKSNPLKKISKVVRKPKRATRLRSNDVPEVHSENSTTCDEVTKANQQLGQIALSMSNDRFDCFGSSREGIDREKGESLGQRALKINSKPRPKAKGTKNYPIVDHFREDQIRKNQADSPCMDDPPCDEFESNQLEQEATKVVRKTKRAARLKCDDELVDANKSNEWKLDLSQSDSAIEKALIQRLRKLEAITDQYDEQSDVIRRKLKKHRRNMWLKRQQSCLDPRSSNPANVLIGKAMMGRFLPDVHDLVQLDCDVLNGKDNPRSTDTEVNRIQGNLFGKRKGTKVAVSQPTLTQMIRGAKDPSEDHDISRIQFDAPDAIENINVVDLLVDGSDCSVESHPDVSMNGAVVDDNDDASEALSTRPIPLLPSPPPKVHRVELFKDPVVGDTHRCAVTCSSIWDAFRYGMYDSSWDQWLVNTTNRDSHAAMTHLLQLLDQSVLSPNRTPSQAADFMQSPSCLSVRAQALASSMVEKVNSNDLLRPNIELVNPNWKENICFALIQKDERDVSNALSNVRNTKQTLLRLKSEILSNLDRQEMLLSVYEETLQSSLSRFGATNDPSSPGRPLLSPRIVASSSLPRSPVSIPPSHHALERLSPGGTSRCGLMCDVRSTEPL